jgi:hypothetical protein
MQRRQLWSGVPLWGRLRKRMDRFVVGCRAERLAQSTERIGLREGDGARWRLVRRELGESGSREEGSSQDMSFFLEFWSREWELNPRPADYESAALPLSYLGPD